MILLLLTITAFPLTFEAKGQAKVTKESFGKTSDGQGVDIYTLTNRHGVEAKITNYGGIVTSLKVPDRNGKLDDVVLGFDNLDAYLKRNPYFGAIIGRYGNRIAKGHFTLNGVEYKLAVNNGDRGVGADLSEQRWRRRLSGKSLSQSYLYADERKRGED